MTAPPFWLSHHASAEFNRTYAWGRFRVCARCLGTYPMLLMLFFAQFLARAPLRWRWDDVWAIGLFLPALLDWVWGRFHPQQGSNLWRTATGVLLGAALARSIYVHVQTPWPSMLLAQMGLGVLGVTVALRARSLGE
ncbi:MAG: DUF2085 domain-containing protein [Myxococcaceae bacterium]